MMHHDMILLGLTLGTTVWAALAAAVLLFSANAIVVYLVVRLPENYFCEPPGRSRLRQQHKILYFALRIAKNVLGAVMVLLGGLLTLPGVPGPGLVLIVLGLTLVEFPGKRRLARNLVRRKSIHGTMNWLRARFGKPPLVIPPPPVRRRGKIRAAPAVSPPEQTPPREKDHA